MGRKSRERKTSKHEKNPNSDEKQLLLKKNSDGGNKDGANGKVTLKRVESRIITAAPLASETDFEDVPVLTICPYCNQKIVTKTHFDKKKTICFCCCVCHPTLAFIFKDVIHSCPKCNEEITTYNRFLFCFRGFSSRKLDRNNNKNFRKLESKKRFEYELLEDAPRITSDRNDDIPNNNLKQQNDETVKTESKSQNDEMVKDLTDIVEEDHSKTDSTSSTTSSMSDKVEVLEKFEQDSTISPLKSKNKNGIDSAKTPKKKTRRRFSLPKKQKPAQSSIK